MKILCIGNIAYDCTVSGKEFIKEGVRNSYDNVKFNTGGPTSNAASVLAKYGDEVDFYGQVGNDANGKRALEEMASEGINIENVNVSDNVMTPFSYVIINETNATRTICSMRSKSDYNCPQIEKINYQKGYDYILTDGKYPKDALKLMINNPHAISIIDAGRVNEGIKLLCHYVDYLICSEDFANDMTGLTINGDYQNDCNVYKQLQNIFSQAKITITVGAKGYIYAENGQIITKPAYEPEEPTVDTNAAGDIFHGAFTHAIANGYTYEESLEFANVTASLSTTRRGGRASIPDLNEVEESLLNNNHSFTRSLKK